MSCWKGGAQQLHRLIVEVNGRLHDLTNRPEAEAAPLLEAAKRITLASAQMAETVIHEPARGRWTKGGRTATEDELPDTWDLPGGRRLDRPGGKSNPHKNGQGNRPEVKAKWRLSSTNQTSSSTRNPKGQR